jgi:hypothetical protein
MVRGARTVQITGRGVEDESWLLGCVDVDDDARREGRRGEQLEVGERADSAGEGAARASDYWDGPRPRATPTSKSYAIGFVGC